MTTFPTNCIPSCPTCAVEGTSNRSINANTDGSFVCGNCNTKWREIGTNAAPVRPPLTQLRAKEPRHEIRKKGANSFPKKNPWAIAGIAGLTFAAAICVSVFLQPQSNPKLANSNFLAINDIAIKRITSRGRRIWSISAIIKNNTQERLVIPPLAFYAGEQGSSGYLKWIYKPAMQSLAPGADFRFRTLVARPNNGSKQVRLDFLGQDLNPG